MRALKVQYKGFTRQGDAKLKRVMTIARKIGMQTLQREMQGTVKRAVLMLSPTPNEEQTELSRGDAAGVGNVGTFGGGRFLKASGQRFVRVAIAEEPIDMSIRGGSFITAKFGDASRLNHKIGFSWIVKGALRSTNILQPTWANLIQVWENGGSFRIVPRGGRYRLQPEPGVYVPSMDKAIVGRNMFSKGYTTTKAVIRSKIARAIKKGVQRGTK